MTNQDYLKSFALFFTVLAALAAGISTGFAIFLLWGVAAGIAFGIVGFLVNLVIFHGETKEALISIFTGKFWSDICKSDYWQPNTNNLYKAATAVVFAFIISVGCGFVSFGFVTTSSSTIFLSLGFGATASTILPWIIALGMGVAMTAIVFNTIIPVIEDPGLLIKFIEDTFYRKTLSNDKKESWASVIVRWVFVLAAIAIAFIATLATVGAWGDKLATFLGSIPNISNAVCDGIVAAFVWISFIGNLAFNSRALITFTKLLLETKTWANLEAWFKSASRGEIVFCVILVVPCVIVNGIANGALARLGSTVFGGFIQMVSDSTRSIFTGALFSKAAFKNIWEAFTNCFSPSGDLATDHTSSSETDISAGGGNSSVASESLGDTATYPNGFGSNLSVGSSPEDSSAPTKPPLIGQ